MKLYTPSTILLPATWVNIETSFADVYYYRGFVRAEIKDRKGVREDYQKAAELYQREGKSDKYQQVLAKIRELD